MRIAHCLSCAVAFSATFYLASLCGCNDAEPSAKTPPAKPSTDGVWKVKSATIQGQAIPAADNDEITLTISGGDYLVTGRNLVEKGVATFDLKATPPRMTIKYIEGRGKGSTNLAIFDFPDASTMRVSYALYGPEFPTTFTSTAENQLYSVTYVRQQ